MIARRGCNSRAGDWRDLLGVRTKTLSGSVQPSLE